jgi:hypothetical protein
MRKMTHPVILVWVVNAYNVLGIQTGTSMPGLLIQKLVSINTFQLPSVDFSQMITYFPP